MPFLTIPKRTSRSQSADCGGSKSGQEALVNQKGYAVELVHAEVQAGGHTGDDSMSLMGSRRSSTSSRSYGVNTRMLIGVDVYTGTDRVKVVDIAVNTNRDDVCDDESGLTWAERDNLAREVAALKVKAYDFANKASQLTGVEEQLRSKTRSVFG